MKPIVDGDKVARNPYPGNSQEGPEDEQISIWSIRRKLFVSYFWLFRLLFVGVSGAAVWLQWNGPDVLTGWVTTIMAAMGFASARVLWLAAFSIIAVEAGNVIVEYLILDRYKRGKEEGRQEGIEENQRQWREWYERSQAAQREGLPFDEPPPGVEEKGGK